MGEERFDFENLKNSKLQTPDSEPPRISLDEVLVQLTSAEPGGLSDLPVKILFWGRGAGGISSYVAGWMAGQGTDVVVLDGANRFDPYMVSFFAKRAMIPPEKLLKSIRIARAFTCYQMATLIEEKLFALLRHEGAIEPEFLPSPFGRLRRQSVHGSTESVLSRRSSFESLRTNGESKGSPRTDCGSPKIDRLAVRPEPFDSARAEPVEARMSLRTGLRRPCVILLGPITTFLDEDVAEREVRPLFERSLRKAEKMAEEGVSFFLFQSSSPSNLPFPSIAKKRGRGRMNSRGSHFIKRLFQFCSLVWEIDLDNQGPKLVLKKSSATQGEQQASRLISHWGKHRIPSTKHQTIDKISMTEIPKNTQD